MAYTQQITAINFKDIGQVGQTPNFQDFTEAEMQTDGYAGIVTRTSYFPNLFWGVVGDYDGKLLVVSSTADEAEIYLKDLFDSVNRTVESKVFINSVSFIDEPLSTVIDKDSKYVERLLVVRVNWTAKVRVL